MAYQNEFHKKPIELQTKKKLFEILEFQQSYLVLFMFINYFLLYSIIYKSLW
jgi:hypothetical protein